MVKKAATKNLNKHERTYTMKVTWRVTSPNMVRGWGILTRATSARVAIKRVKAAYPNMFKGVKGLLAKMVD